MAGKPKLPWFPFYGRDFFGDEKVQLMTLRQVGIYLVLLWHQWEHGSIPSVEDCQRFPVFAANGADEDVAVVHRLCFRALPLGKNRAVNLKLARVKKQQSEKDVINHVRAMKGGVARSLLQGSLKPAIQSQSQSQSQREKKIEEKRGVVPAVNPQVVDELWIAELKEKPAYGGIDVLQELGKARVWCETNHRMLTRRFFVNWLNRAERPLRGVKGQAPARSLVELGMRAKS